MHSRVPIMQLCRKRIEFPGLCAISHWHNIVVAVHHHWLQAGVRPPPLQQHGVLRDYLMLHSRGVQEVRVRGLQVGQCLLERFWICDMIREICVRDGGQLQQPSKV